MNFLVSILFRELNYYKGYQEKLAQVACNGKSTPIIKNELYTLNVGSSDFMPNYYVNPLINKAFTVDWDSSYLLDSFKASVKVFYYYYSKS